MRVGCTVLMWLNIQTLKHFFLLQTILTELYKRTYASPVFQTLSSEQDCIEYYRIIEVEGTIDIASLDTNVISNLICIFLQNVPEALLCTHLYNDWVEASMISVEIEQLAKLLTLCQKLPKQNYVLLQYILMILNNIRENHVLTPSILASNVGHHMLWPTQVRANRPGGILDHEEAQRIIRNHMRVCRVLECLIKHSKSIINIW